MNKDTWTKTDGQKDRKIKRQMDKFIWTNGSLTDRLTDNHTDANIPTVRLVHFYS
jgi:hypothetical protein